MLEYNKGVLEQRGQKTWKHINYKTVAFDILKIQRKYRMSKICFDRSGVGDAVAEMFTKEIPLEEVVTSLPRKLEIIDLIHFLFQNNKLIIKDKELYNQILEQEQHKSDAGNILYRHPSNRHDDIFWALGYACYAARGYFGGTPNHTMVRYDREIRDVDSQLRDEFGSDWNIYSS